MKRIWLILLLLCFAIPCHSAGYLGDFASGATVYVTFNLYSTAGVPVAFDGSPTPYLAVYIDTSSTAIVTGITPTSIATGLYSALIPTSAGSYLTGHDYYVADSTGTVNTGTPLAGVVVGRFSIQNRTAKSIALDSTGAYMAAVPTAVAIRTEMDSNSTKLAHLQADITSTPAGVGAAMAISGGQTVATVTNVTNPVKANDSAGNAITVAAIQSGLMTAGAYTAPDNTDVSSILTQVNKLHFTGTAVQSVDSGGNAIATATAVAAIPTALDTAGVQTAVWGAATKAVTNVPSVTLAASQPNYAPLLASSYTSPLDSAGTGNAVWGAATRTLTSGGSGLDSAGVQLAVWSAPTPGSWASGSMGYALTNVSSGTTYGSQNKQLVYTVKINGVYIAGALVELFTDSGYSGRVAYGITSTNGTVTFSLNAGSYYAQTTYQGVTTHAGAVGVS
jgi:hypothetical protein